jgi:DNA-binding transcriptional regulator YiaG
MRPSSDAMSEAYITGDVLRWARERRKLSQPELATLLKVKSNQIELWESEDAHPPRSDDRVIARFRFCLKRHTLRMDKTR